MKMTYIAGLGLALGLSLSPALAQKQVGKAQNNKESFSQALDVMGASMALLNRYFVDSVDMSRLSRYGIDAMLESLDPYTEYYSAEDNDKLRLLTMGEYGGIGAVISQRKDSTVMINEPFEGMPAARAGLLAGDVILEVDGRDFRHRATSDSVTRVLKGAPGSVVSLLVQRMGDKKPRRISFKREQIALPAVPYSTILDGGYGYISLSSFTSGCASDVRGAVEGMLKQDPQLKGLILDLRGNGGGLLEEAVKIVNLFVPEGKVVVTTKSRPGVMEDVVHKTRSKALAPSLPLVVLIDDSSASASEIVAGALQDMDRAVLIGRKSFGKGLVQTTLQLPHGGVLKMTTSKYYIPSGRCIQRIDYAQTRRGNSKGAVMPDSLTKVFYTAAGRPVHDAGGIVPDVEVKQDSLPTILYYLSYDPDVFDWVTSYVQQHKKIAAPRDFHITEADYEALGQVLHAKNFDYDRQSDKALSSLESIAKLEGYYGRNEALLKQLHEALKPNLARDLQELKPQIKSLIETQILQRYYYRRGVAERELQTDKVVAEAKAILGDDARRMSLLSGKHQ